MPPSASSRKDPNPQLKAQEKEAKRARGALSCAECRRLKLKCDKTVPCSSCKRRGCSAICPNGSLITGQGTRFVLADTEKLHHKIAQMSDRIRLLEDALSVLQSTLSSEPHPLLNRELLKIKSSIDLHAAVDDEAAIAALKQEPEEESVIDAFGTLAIRDDGAATFYGRSAGSESLLIGEASPSEDHGLRKSLQPSTSSSNSYTHVRLQASPSATNAYMQQHLSTNGILVPSPKEAVAALSSSFPLSTNSFQNINIDMDYLLSNFLPKWDDCWKLAHLYLEQAPWFFGAVTKKQLMEEMLPMWYCEARGPVPGGAPSPPSAVSASPVSNHAHPSTTNAASPAFSTTSSSSTPTQGGNSAPGAHQTTRTAHDLALLFMILCFGALTDINLPAAPENEQADGFYQLTKAALVLDPVLERSPSVSTVQALSLMAIYEGICSSEGSIERTWALFGIAVKLAQSIGLHRDCARWKLSPFEVQKRRALFWELFITDCWQSLATGRLATFSLPFVDCELPQDPDQTITDDGSIQPSFPAWKARFGAECVSAVVQGTLTSRAPKYSIILNLDQKVRDMELPLYTQQVLEANGQGIPWSDKELGLADTMSRLMPINYRELTLLYIHRCFFAHAISTHPNDPIKSQYAPSFLAGYRSACTILGSVKQQFTLFPRQIARFWVLWTHVFSASVMLASVATLVSKQSQVAHAALIELKTACDLFENAAKFGGRSVKFLPIMKRLHSKALKAFEDSQNGIPASIPNDILKPSRNDEDKNELEIFGGKTHTVKSSSRPSPNSGSHPSSRAASGSPLNASQQSMQTSRQNLYQNPPPPRQGQGQGQIQEQPRPELPLGGHQQHEHLISEYPSFEGVHQSLVNELQGFGGRIEAQIKQAYSEGGLANLIYTNGEENSNVSSSGDVGIVSPIENQTMEQQKNGMIGVEFQASQSQQEMEYQAQQQRELEYQQQQQREIEYQQQREMEYQQQREMEYQQQQQLKQQSGEMEKDRRTELDEERRKQEEQWAKHQEAARQRERRALENQRLNDNFIASEKRKEIQNERRRVELELAEREMNAKNREMFEVEMKRQKQYQFQTVPQQPPPLPVAHQTQPTPRHHQHNQYQSPATHQWTQFHHNPQPLQGEMVPAGPSQQQHQQGEILSSQPQHGQQGEIVPSQPHPYQQQLSHCRSRPSMIENQAQSTYSTQPLPPPTVIMTSYHQPQHPRQSLQILPPRYIPQGTQGSIPTPLSTTATTGGTTSETQTPATPYDVQSSYPVNHHQSLPPQQSQNYTQEHHMQSQQPYAQSSQEYLEPQPSVPSQGYVEYPQATGYSQYWAAAPSIAVQELQQEPFTYTQPQDHTQSYSHYPQGHLAPQQQNQQYHSYTPSGVLRGIAAEDVHLQETWQTYMHDGWDKTVMPRQPSAEENYSGRHGAR